MAATNRSTKPMSVLAPCRRRHRTGPAPHPPGSPAHARVRDHLVKRLGDVGLGVLKYITAGGCGIWWLVDIFTAGSRCDTYNRNKAQEIVGVRIAEQLVEYLGNGVAINAVPDAVSARASASAASTYAFSDPAGPVTQGRAPARTASSTRVKFGWSPSRGNSPRRAYRQLNSLVTSCRSTRTRAGTICRMLWTVMRRRSSGYSRPGTHTRTRASTRS